MKVFLDNTTDPDLINFIKQKIPKDHKIEWVDNYDRDCYWVYLLTPSSKISDVFSILSHVTFARKEKLVICILISHNSKSLNEKKLNLVRKAMSMLHSENSEILYNIDDLILFLKEISAPG